PPLKTALINPVTNSPEPLDLPGPTGESNRLTFSPRSAILCLGPGAKVTAAQAKAVTDLGGSALTTAGRLAPSKLTKIENISGALFWGAEGEARAYAVALAARPDAIVPLITGLPDLAHVQHERHICIDTTAAGGNAALLSEIGADE
ncbi:MAG: bifunctional proline dehydrogenase/L-glutamate gamma-semialdehyde dehydrogenase, partial [Rhodobacteraceae bacterium]|nr:bifunctional proline dehydrogenase/L-glutamate gamma-semialdehyde dehydrogenase [Paracoccaceae bacterium]